MTEWALFLLAGATVVWPAQKTDRIASDEHGEAADAVTTMVAADGYDAAAVFDVFAACLRAGLPPAVAARAVCDSHRGPVAQFFRHTTDLMMLGADHETAWKAAARSPETKSLVTAAQRSARAGTPLAEAVSELAGDLRQAATDAASERAQKAAVLIAAPLGVCFLPAFMCLGIAPVVMGLANQLMSGSPV
ncbi:type II secretion system F family protein [Hoyosella sp. YIM 151337]|uniref:type II secretion system F family protein n=1 Tax=Hoyosella sp. YIM 151337 TaxID=2992742 RepID=UPI0022361BFB|nr:type II secretion system F family protein [Hoyosella sp. YIM 151337]MCW4352724.1 type II secretion system F family protein [Hoyosella sp. YIM 151337]